MAANFVALVCLISLFSVVVVSTLLADAGPITAVTGAGPEELVKNIIKKLIK
jgi:hypothetical protein